MASTDRTEIAGLMTQYFPEMAKATSDEWHGFMNEISGIFIMPDIPNTEAFDAWRQALSKQGLPVWGYSEERLAVFRKYATKAKMRLAEVLAAQDATLDALRKEAPSVSAKDLLEAAARIAKGKK